MGDTISRQAAIDAIHEDADWLAAQGSDWQVERMERDKSILKSLPTVQPKHGKWHTKNISCAVLDVCDQCMKGVRHVAPFYDFCPRCGADMRGDSE